MTPRSTPAGGADELFPLGDALATGTSGTALDPSGPRHPAAGQPFGLRFARVPIRLEEVDLTAVRYDEGRQLAVLRERPGPGGTGGGEVALHRHSMGVTLQTTGQVPREDEIHDKS